MTNRIDLYDISHKNPVTWIILVPISLLWLGVQGQRYLNSEAPPEQPSPVTYTPVPVPEKTIILVVQPAAPAIPAPPEPIPVIPAPPVVVFNAPSTPVTEPKRTYPTLPPTLGHTRPGLYCGIELLKVDKYRKTVEVYLAATARTVAIPLTEDGMIFGRNDLKADWNDLKPGQHLQAYLQSDGSASALFIQR